MPDIPDAPLNLNEVNRQHILSVMAMTGGKIQGAAAVLGLHPSPLRNRMRKLDIPFTRKP